MAVNGKEVGKTILPTRVEAVKAEIGGQEAVKKEEGATQAELCLRVARAAAEHLERLTGIKPRIF